MSAPRAASQSPPVVAFSIASGGALDRVLDAVHLGGKTRRDVARRCVVLSLVAWAPLLVATWLDGSGVSSFARDVGTHARLLVALPLLLVAERTVERRFQHALAHLAEVGIIGDESVARVGRAVTRAARVRDSRIAELAIVVATVALSIDDATTATGPAWMFERDASGVAHLSAAGWVEVALSAPLYRVVLLRWMWRWLVWIGVSIALGRAGLALSALHSDRMGGLGVLAEAHTSAGWLLVAVGTTLAAKLTTRCIALHLSVSAFHHVVLAFAVLGPAVCVAPLLAFAWPLELARRAAHEEYAAASADFARRYRRVHLDPRARTPVEIGSPDPSTAEDLCASFERVIATRRAPIDRGLAGFLLACALAPMLLFYMREIPVLEIARRLLEGLG